MGVKRRSGGFALLMVFMLITIAAVVGISYIYGAQVKTASTNNLMLASQARYLAESGLEHGRYVLRTGVTPFGSAAAPNGPYHVEAEDGGYVFYITSTSVPNDYQIVGTGTAGGISQTVAMTVRLKGRYGSTMRSTSTFGMTKHWWRLGDSGLTADDEKDFKDGTYVNGVTRGVEGPMWGELNTAANFDGIDDYVQLSGIWSYEGKSKLTIGCWAKADGWVSPRPRLIAKSNGSSGLADQYYLLGTDAGRNLRFVLKSNNVSIELQSTGNPIQIGEWIFAVATYNSSEQQLKLYKNGELIASKTVSGLMTDDGDIDARIGDTPQGDPCRWNGPIDEVFMVNDRLTAETIKELYDARIPSVKVISWDD